MADVNDVATLVLENLGPMSAMKFQKLVYYCQGWHLARENKELYADAIEAWIEGPVVRSLWQVHRKEFYVDSWNSGNSARLTGVERQTVEWVCAKYGQFKAEELSQMTHQEVPWVVARGALPPGAKSSAKLSTKVMANFYGRQVASPAAAVLHATANAALEDVELDSNWVERLHDVANGAVSADDLVSEELERLSHG
jgi:uncharacterized phage-associated protein